MKRWLTLKAPYKTSWRIFIELVRTLSAGGGGEAREGAAAHPDFFISRTGADKGAAERDRGHHPRGRADAVLCHRRLGLDTAEHNGTLVGSGLLPSRRFQASHSFSRRYRVHRSLRGRARARRTMVFGRLRRRHVPSAMKRIAGRIARSPRPVPAGTTFHCERQ